MRHARLSGYLLLITGSLHTLLGIVSFYPQLSEMAREGIIGTADASVERALALWFLVAGGSLILMGVLALGYSEPLPAAFGWGLLVLSVGGVLLTPISGFWVFVLLALYVLITAYRAASGRSR